VAALRETLWGHSGFPKNKKMPVCKKHAEQREFVRAEQENHVPSPLPGVKKDKNTKMF